MRRAVRFVGRALVVLAAAGLISGLSGCALLSGQSSVTNPKTGQGTDYPCGLTGVVCVDTNPYTCCPMNHLCADDGAKYCENTFTDPSDPTYMRRVRVPRSALLARGE